MSFNHLYYMLMSQIAFMFLYFRKGEQFS